MNNNTTYHTPVLLKEAIEALQISKGNRYIDGTLGGGGHAQAILDRGGVVLGIDRDEDAIKKAQERFKNDKNITIVRGNFKEIQEIAKKVGFMNCSGILLDIGTSVHQLKDPTRGFSFKDHEQLDMRMDQRQNLSALEVVNEWPKSELIEIFEKYGEESEAEEIAEQIVKERKREKIIYADKFAEVVTKAKKKREAGINPATKVFQAIRIAVNDELEALNLAIRSGLEILEPEGRLVIISFHSLEDRIVKQMFKELELKGKGKVITKKPITPSFGEKEINRKARSAKMRIFEKN